MAGAVGIIVANLYYLQPLLHEVRSNFAIDSFQTSSLLTLAQVGYAVGLALLVPLGDLFARRRLIVVIFVIAAASMVWASLMHGFVLFATATVVIGLSSVGGQVLIPFGADLSTESERGRVIARLMTGLLGGVLLSRTLAGLVAELVGWRGVYLFSAALLALMAVALHFTLPAEAPRTREKYHRLVASSFAMLGSSSLLRRRGWIGAMSFGSFNAFWATLAFHLSAAPFHLSEGVIGLFGLFGLAGIVAANVAGRQADRQRTHSFTVMSALLITAAFALMLIGGNNLACLIVGIVILDTGVQGIQVTNQAIIYTIAPEKRSRTNSAYMVCFFSGASVGSLAGGFAYAHFGWTGTCTLGLAMGLACAVPAAILRSEPDERSDQPLTSVDTD